jgi:D-glycero-alpha-D-manno-heptose-7-phosphate kinase
VRDRDTLAVEAIHVEQGLGNEVVSARDRSNAACGGFNHVKCHTDDSMDAKHRLAPKDR